jgi:hypothetical protein
MSSSIDLFERPDTVRLHNRTTATGSHLEFVTDATQWSYAISVPITAADPPRGDVEAVVSVDVQVLEGTIGLGITDASQQRFISSEVDAKPAASPTRIELRPSLTDPSAHLMIRNTAAGAVPSRFRLLGLSLDYRARDRRLLVPTKAPAIAASAFGTTTRRGTFDVLISHSSRTWNADQCDRDYLAQRYTKPGRLDDLPPFDSLPPNAAPYHGLLSLFRLSFTDDGVRGQVLQHYVSPEKVVHAAVVGQRVVVCFDAGVATFAQRPDVSWIEVIPESSERITDPWFGGLHTVVPGAGTTCLLSSSGADAVLWLDLERKKVVRRWRLPASRYGMNYPLDETTSLIEHYIPNDVQLGHLNCAAPDGAGGAFFSVLGQGDVGRVDEAGRCRLLATGYVGCHGVRYDAAAGLLYFSDSCRGRLMRIDGVDRATLLFDAGSRWLHDAVHLSGGLFLLTLGDRNRLVLADTNAGRPLAEWDFSAVGGSIQFMSVAPDGV